MSWQTYVDTNLVGTGKVTRAAIVGLGGGIWAASPGYQLSSEEEKGIIASFSNLASAQANGVRLNGNKFFVVSTTPDRSIYAKKGADGATIVKTKQAIIIAEYVAPLQAGESTPIVESLADYLISVGF